MATPRIVTTEGIVLSRIPYGDSSWIVRWLTRDAGRVATLAKGARGRRSAFAGQLDLMFRCDVQFIRCRNGTVHTLRELVLREPHLGIRRELATLAAAEYFAALVEAATEPETPLAEEYGLLNQALGYLAAKPASWRVVERFEARLMDLLGLHGGPKGAQVHGHHFTVPPQRERLARLLPPPSLAPGRPETP